MILWILMMLLRIVIDANIALWIIMRTVRKRRMA
jgi:hypothetical protein